ncbi:MAG: helix-turn-helix domain-containing protein, partial [Bacteroidaceae bacterium]|nr:helix-turn-helix domain-containing protein [Bacteroidaceae bacterium]
MKQEIFPRLLISLACLFMSCALPARQALFYGSSHLSNSLITTIAQTSDGLLWVGTENGLNRFDGYRFTAMQSLSQSGITRPTEVTVLYPDASHRLWVGTARGLYLHDRSTDRFLSVTFPDSLKPRVTRLTSLPDGKLAAGTSGYGTFLVDPDELVARSERDSIPGGEAAFVRPDDTTTGLTELAPKGVQLTCATADSEGNIYIGTRGDGLFWLPKHQKTIQRMEVSTLAFDLNRARVQALFVDRQGNLWVGCSQKGLLMIPLQQQPLFSTWSFAEQNQKTGTYVSAIAPAGPPQSPSAPSVWCTVEDDGVYGFSAAGRLVAHPTAPKGTESLLRDSQGAYWLGADGGLWSYDPTSGAREQKLFLADCHLNFICELPGGVLAVSDFGRGLLLFDKHSGQITHHYTMHDTDTLGRGRLANDWIFDMDVDQRDRLWIATSSGVCCYEPATRSFHPEGWEVLMSHEKCTAVEPLSSGEILIACEQGIFRWDRQQGLRREAGTEPMEGLTVGNIIEDASHELWFATNKGIWQWNSTAQTLAAYIGTYGMQEREFVQSSSCQLPDGQIHFGTADGIVSFFPDQLRTHHPSTNRVHLTAFVIADTPASTLTRSNGRAVMQEAVGDSHEFSLSYLDATFHMEFSLLDFSNAQGVTFEYRIKGENRWQRTPKGTNSIAFSHLAPKTYELEVRAQTGGTYTPTETYIITVRPPWWRTHSAMRLYLLLLLAASGAVAYAYHRHVQHQLNSEKLHFLMSAINTQDTPLTLDDMKRAISSFVQSRKHQRAQYGDSAAIADQLDQPERQSNDELLMERIVQSVNRHLDDSEFSVEQLCTEVGISRAHLHRKMKDMTGMPITEFIRNIRLEQAARLLRERKLNITQVAYSVGFSNLGYFSTVFRKHFGVSPRD